MPPVPRTARLICDKAQMRCTSIAVIHQPRWKTLACFDQVVLLATGGYLVYSGPVPDSVAYFAQSFHLKVSEGDNPADLFLDFIGEECDVSLHGCYIYRVARAHMRSNCERLKKPVCLKKHACKLHHLCLTS